MPGGADSAQVMDAADRAKHLRDVVWNENKT